MKTIILPTDFSENSLHACRYAIHLFSEEEVEFLLLHVYGADIYTTASALSLEAGSIIVEKAMEQSRVQLETFREMLQTMHGRPGHRFTAVSRYNFIPEAIAELIAVRSGENEPVSLVVMGTKGATGAREVWFGSNAVTVMNKVHAVPIILVPEKSDIRIPKEIVMPSSYRHQYHYDELAMLHELAHKHHSVVRIMHIGDSEDLEVNERSNKASLKSLLVPLEMSCHTLTGVDPETAIRCFVQSRDSDMIALVNRKHSFFENLTRKSTVKGLGYHSKVPLLVMNASNDA